MMHRLKIITIILANAVLPACSTVGKNEAFLAYKNNITALKFETDKVFTEALKLDLNKGQKLSAVRALGRAADSQQALQEALIKQYENKKRIDAIRRALEKAETGQGELSELIDRWVDVHNKAQRALKKTRESSNTEPDMLKRTEAAAKVAEEALAERIDELRSEYAVASALAPRLKDSADKALERNKQRQIESDEAISFFILDRRGTEKEPFQWGRISGEVPSSLALKYKKASVIECFVAFEEYSDLLAKLANPQLINPEELKSSAGKINASANKLLKVDLNVSNGSEVALVSQAALGIAQSYLRNRQARYLQGFLVENQATVDRFAKLFQSALIQLRENIDMYYKTSIDAAVGDRDSFLVGDAAKMTNVVSSMFSINEIYTELIQVIKNLSTKAYKLSSDHANLASSITSPALTGDFIDNAGAQINSIATGVDKSLALNRYNDAQFAAENSGEIAADYERKHAYAIAETLKAKGEYDLAKARADANPKDSAAKAYAEYLLKQHLNLKTISDQLKIQADYYRALHVLDKAEAARRKPAE